MTHDDLMTDEFPTCAGGVLIASRWPSVIAAHGAETQVSAFRACVGSSMFECDLHPMVLTDSADRNSHQFEHEPPLAHNQRVCVWGLDCFLTAPIMILDEFPPVSL